MIKCNPLKKIHIYLSKTCSSTLTKFSFNLHYEGSDIQYRRGNEPTCILYNHTRNFNLTTCLSAAERLNHKNYIFYLKRGLLPFFLPPIINTIIQGILNGTNKTGQLQPPPFFLTFKDPIASEIINALNVQQLLGWTNLLIGRLSYKWLTSLHMCSNIKTSTKAFYSLTKNIITYTLNMWQQYNEEAHLGVPSSMINRNKYLFI